MKWKYTRIVRLNIRYERVQKYVNVLTSCVLNERYGSSDKIIDSTLVLQV